MLRSRILDERFEEQKGNADFLHFDISKFA